MRFAFSGLGASVVLACATPRAFPRPEDPIPASPIQPDVAWRSSDGAVQCAPVDAWLRLPRGAWRVVAAAPRRLLMLQEDKDARITVLVEASASSASPKTLGADLIADWADAMRPLVKSSEKFTDATGAMHERRDARGFSVVADFQPKPRTGTAYHLAYRAVGRGSQVCRVAAVSALPVASAAPAALDRAVAAFESRNVLLSATPPPASRPGAVTGSLCAFASVLAVLNGVAGGPVKPGCAK
jgi:hypothetical protein